MHGESRTRSKPFGGDGATVYQGFSEDDSFRYTGLQYIDFQFDGADILAAVRAGGFHMSGDLEFLWWWCSSLFVGQATVAA
jgi:hypothetical protein